MFKNSFPNDSKLVKYICDHQTMFGLSIGDHQVMAATLTAFPQLTI